MCFNLGAKTKTQPFTCKDKHGTTLSRLWIYCLRHPYLMVYTPDVELHIINSTHLFSHLLHTHTHTHTQTHAHTHKRTHACIHTHTHTHTLKHSNSRARVIEVEEGSGARLDGHTLLLHICHRSCRPSCGTIQASIPCHVCGVWTIAIPTHMQLRRHISIPSGL